MKTAEKKSQKLGPSPQKVAADRKAAAEKQEARKRKEAALKAVEKRQEDAHEISKRARDQIVDAVALTHMSESDKLQVGYNLADAFNLRGEDRDSFLSAVSRHHSVVIQEAAA